MARFGKYLQTNHWAKTNSDVFRGDPEKEIEQPKLRLFDGFPPDVFSCFFGDFGEILSLKQVTSDQPVSLS